MRVVKVPMRFRLCASRALDPLLCGRAPIACEHGVDGLVYIAVADKLGLTQDTLPLESETFGN